MSKMGFLRLPGQKRRTGNLHCTVSFLRTVSILRLHAYFGLPLAYLGDLPSEVLM